MAWHRHQHFNLVVLFPRFSTTIITHVSTYSNATQTGPLFTSTRKLPSITLQLFVQRWKVMCSSAPSEYSTFIEVYPGFRRLRQMSGGVRFSECSSLLYLTPYRHLQLLIYSNRMPMLCHRY